VPNQSFISFSQFLPAVHCARYCNGITLLALRPFNGVTLLALRPFNGVTLLVLLPFNLEELFDEVSKCLLSFDAESFVFQFANQKMLRLTNTELIFCLLFCMGVKLGP
jgi:hypothetical protein